MTTTNSSDIDSKVADIKKTADSKVTEVKKVAATKAADIKDVVAAKRAELDETLDAIEDKLNVSKRASEATERAKASYNANPVPWIVGATAAVVVVGGLIAWAIFGDD